MCQSKTLKTPNGHEIQVTKKDKDGKLYQEYTYGTGLSFASWGEEIDSNIPSLMDNHIEPYLLEAVRQGKIVYDRSVRTDKPSELLVLHYPDWQAGIEDKKLPEDIGLALYNAVGCLLNGRPWMEIPADMFERITDLVAIIYLGTDVVDLYEQLSQDAVRLVLKIRPNAYVGGCEEDTAEDEKWPPKSTDDFPG